jgi:hypothetical protein
MRLLSICAITACAAAAATGAAAAPAPRNGGHETTVGIAARTIKMAEKGSMRLANAPGTTIKEKGTTSGTFNGSVFATFTAFSADKGAFRLTMYLSGGTLVFTGGAHIHVNGPTGYVEGSARVAGGTGRFAHASSGAMSYRVIVNRRNYYATTEMSGRLSF